MKAYTLTMTEKDIVLIDSGQVYFRPDIKFDVNTFSFVPNTEGVLLRGTEFLQGLYYVTLIKLGDALSPKCTTLTERIDLDCFEL